MATRRVIKSVLRNFLGTYTSRYSEIRGYWLFGFLVPDLGELHFDLLSRRADRLETAQANPSTPVTPSARLTSPAK
jgi:hypothetical protein